MIHDPYLDLVIFQNKIRCRYDTDCKKIVLQMPKWNSCIHHLLAKKETFNIQVDRE